MDDNNIRKAAAAMGVIKYGIAVAVIIYILATNIILPRFAETGDPVFMTVGSGMKVMLIAFLVMSAAAFVQNLIALIIMVKGDEETDFGSRYLIITGVIGKCAGQVIQLVMGILFAFLGIWSMTGASGMIKEGDEKGFLIVGGIFAVAGIGCAIGAVVGLVKEIRQALSGGM